MMMVEAFLVVFGLPLALLLTAINSRVSFLPEKGMTETTEGLAKICGGLQLILVFVFCFWKLLQS